MTKFLPALLSCALLAGCGTAGSGNRLGNLSISHSSLSLPPLAVPAPAPVVLPPPCPADLLADIPDRPPVPAGAGYPAAETPQAAAAIEQYNTWLTSMGRYAKAGWARAAQAKAYCGGKP